MDPGRLFQILVTVSFLIGAVGNVIALWILYKTAKRRNRKHVLLLRCLATNDLVAQIGMLLLMYLRKKSVLPSKWTCVGFVLLRAFGLGSGCVAFVMALERWLALTRPFFYHQVISYQVLKRFLCCLWLSAVILTYLPLFGFGLYYEEPNKSDNKTIERYEETTTDNLDVTTEKDRCIRFRHAKDLDDKIYAYLFFTFGSTLCLCIALCNCSVVWELCRIRSQGKILVRRVSRSIISNRVGCPRYQTPEEVAFAKLMAIVCIIFIVCWGPQVIAVPIAQFLPLNRTSKTFTSIADILLCVYFTLDPFVYVLQNYMEGRFILRCCFFKRSMNSLPTTTTTVGTPTSVLLNPPSFTIPASM